METRNLTLILVPKPIGSSYGLFKKVNADSCEIPATIAELHITSVTPETSIDALLDWLKSAPKVVNQFTPYELRIT